MALLASQAKEKAELAYQDGTLIDFHMVDSGRHCSTSADTTGTVKADTDSDGATSGTIHATTNGSSNCANSRRAVYRVSIENHTYTLEPYEAPGRVAIAFVPIVGIGYLLATQKNSVLYGLLPGTRIQVRAGSGGAFYVKAGKKESRYKLAGAE